MRGVGFATAEALDRLGLESGFNENVGSSPTSDPELRSPETWWDGWLAGWLAGCMDVEAAQGLGSGLENSQGGTSRVGLLD